MKITLLLFTIFIYTINTNAQSENKPYAIVQSIETIDGKFEKDMKQLMFIQEEKGTIFTLRHLNSGTLPIRQWLNFESDKPLTKYFYSVGIYHPEDMSSIILSCYIRELKYQKWDLENLIKYYSNYWQRVEEFRKDRNAKISYNNTFYKFIPKDIIEKTRLEKKEKWNIGTIISGEIVYKSINIGLNQIINLKAEIIEWQDYTLKVKIISYNTKSKRLKRDFIKSYKIQNNVLLFKEYDFFKLEN